MWRLATAFRNPKPKDAGYVELDSHEEEELRTKAKAKNSTLDERISYCEFMLSKYPAKKDKYTNLLRFNQKCPFLTIVVGI